jgi:hypothetical protein
VAEVTGTLNNRGNLEKKGGRIFLNLELANKYLIKMMES